MVCRMITFKIPISKSQISSKFQSQMNKTPPLPLPPPSRGREREGGSSVIGIYLKFGAWYLGLPPYTSPYRVPFVDGICEDRESRETASLSALPKPLNTASTI